MLEKFKSLLNVKKTTETKTVKKFENYREEFFSHPYHQWINENRYTKATFEELFDILPETTKSFLLTTTPLYFLQSSGRFSCSISTAKGHAIIVFPELMSLLKSTMIDHALAILLHEIGHLVYEHANANIDTLTAQCEADNFAASLGYGPQIESFLLDQPESMEKRVRLSNLTKITLAIKNTGQ